MGNRLGGVATRTYRNRGRALAVSAAGVACFLGITAVALTAGGPHSSAGSIVVRGVVVAAALCLLLFALGTALSCIRILHNNAILVVNPVSTRELAWADIQEFREGTWGPVRVCLIVLADGTTLRALGLSGNSAVGDELREHHPIAALNALLEAWKQRS
ncbi:MAG: hypothetical protein NVSMB32_13830 [Actinomycetota bacterium]